jgi:hypothetical protein
MLRSINNGLKIWQKAGSSILLMLLYSVQNNIVKKFIKADILKNLNFHVIHNSFRFFNELLISIIKTVMIVYQYHLIIILQNPYNNNKQILINYQFVDFLLYINLLYSPSLTNCLTF